MNTLTPTPESKACCDQAAAAVAQINPGSPLVKPAIQQGTVLVTIAGIASAIMGILPDLVRSAEIMALFPPDTQKKLIALGVLLSLIGTELARRSGTQAAADVHAVRNLPQPAAAPPQEN